jgi:hypothetical protein
MRRVHRFEAADFATGMQPLKAGLWRIIEGQYRSSTLRIVDTFAEHDVLSVLVAVSLWLLSA